MFHLFTQLVVLLSILIIFPIAADGTSVPTLPIVDLGYELHQASSFDVSECLQFAQSLSYQFFVVLAKVIIN